MSTKICIVGTGAIGSLLAVHLVRGGAEVSVLARGRQLEAIRIGGITVESADGSAHNVTTSVASDDPREIGPQDVVVVAVKATALQDVAASVGPLLSTRTAVVFVTNGIPWWYFDGLTGEMAHVGAKHLDGSGVLRRAFGYGRAIGSVIYSACTLIEPGVVRSVRQTNRLILGEPDGTLSNRVMRVAHLCGEGGLPCEVTSEIRDAVWEKLMTNLVSGPICLLSRSSMSRSFADPVVRDAAVALVREGRAVAEAALGHPLAGSAEEVVDMLGTIEHKPSILQDLELGRPMETEVLFDYPRRLARLTGIATPLLDCIYPRGGMRRRAPSMVGRGATKACVV